MSIPSKHHYLPKFFVDRWADGDGKVAEYRYPERVEDAGKSPEYRPNRSLIIKRKWPSQTAYIPDLYANESKLDPVERQALEMVFMQKVDSHAADALADLEEHKRKSDDSALRSGWSRFLMSLMHRSPERVKHITAKVREYEEGALTAELAAEIGPRYAERRGPDDPETYEEWLTLQPPLTPDLRVRLLRLIIDSKRIGMALNNMHWRVHVLPDLQYGFVTGDQPLLMSDGLGHSRSFVLTPISPTAYFVASNEEQVAEAFLCQNPKALQRSINEAVTRQSRHVIIARDDAQRAFVEKRFLKLAAPVGPSGYHTWEPPLAR
jgi:hypothetical protein